MLPLVFDQLLDVCFCIKQELRVFNQISLRVNHALKRFSRNQLSPSSSSSYLYGWSILVTLAITLAIALAITLGITFSITLIIIAVINFGTGRENSFSTKGLLTTNVAFAVLGPGR